MTFMYLFTANGIRCCSLVGRTATSGLLSFILRLGLTVDRGVDGVRGVEGSDSGVDAADTWQEGLLFAAEGVGGLADALLAVLADDTELFRGEPPALNLVGHLAGNLDFLTGKYGNKKK